MFTSPLHVECAQVHRHVEDKLEEAVPQRVHHHVILRVELGWPGDQTAKQRVDSTCRGRNNTACFFVSFFVPLQTLIPLDIKVHAFYVISCLIFYKIYLITFHAF